MSEPVEAPSCHSPSPEPGRLSVVVATVQKVDADGVWLSTPTSTSCSSCEQQGHCSSGLIAKALPVRQQQLFLAGRVDLLPGQQVEIAVAPGAVLQSALRVYLLPLLVFLAVLVLGNSAEWPEWLQLLIALSLTTGVLAWVRHIESHQSAQLEIRLLRVLPQLAIQQL